jgi:hydroxymethylpyrimidine kinase / phosphomethylpyrimidine kinase / thiamine-phosphate diphosphorylase
MYSSRRPLIWSIAGTDSGGGAGLAADQRAAEAFNVHLCPVVAAVTAQNSLSVSWVEPLPVAYLDAQLNALSKDMPPRVIKTGLLGGADQVMAVARWVDRLREQGPLALVVDPVLRASTGASFADQRTLQAYREELLPRATLITPNRQEAAVLLGHALSLDPPDLPEQARRLQDMGCEAVCITGGDSPDHAGLVQDWILTPQAQGWLGAYRVDTGHSHGTGCTFACAAAAALARGFVLADALILAKMATMQALREGYAAGVGRGPVKATAGFAADPTLLPLLSWDEQPVAAAPALSVNTGVDALYAIVDNAHDVEKVLATGVRTVQLRMKQSPQQTDAEWQSFLLAQIRQSLEASRACGARLIVNDYWQEALDAGAEAVHLGQEDVMMLGRAGRARLLGSGLRLGVSSHSLWELARARTLPLDYVACGPVWPTQTKSMPWHPQGLDNLTWWCAMAGMPVVAVGGVLSAEQAALVGRCGATSVCLVRALQPDPQAVVPAFLQAFIAGARETPRLPVPGLPHPTLASPYGTWTGSARMG